MKFTAVHSKMARAALGLGVRELAELAKVSPDTVARLERGEELKDRTVEAIQAALEAKGLEFTNGGQPGVRMRERESSNYADVEKVIADLGAYADKIGLSQPHERSRILDIRVRLMQRHEYKSPVEWYPCYFEAKKILTKPA